jgi:hypothetical protein
MTDVVLLQRVSQRWGQIERYMQFEKEKVWEEFGRGISRPGLDHEKDFPTVG